MTQPNLFDKLRELIGHIAFFVYLWSIRMTKEQFWLEQEKQAARPAQDGGGQ